MSLAIIAALASATFHPFFPGFARKAAHPCTLNFWGICVAVLVFSFCFFDLEFWKLFFDHWEVVILSGILHSVYTIMMLLLVKQHDFQVLYPLTRLAPIFILMGEVLILSSRFEIVQILGVCSVIVGALIFGFDRSINHVRGKVLLIVVALTFMVTAFHLLDKYLVAYFSASQMWALVLFQIPIMAYFPFKYRKEALLDLKNVKNLIGFSVAMIGTWYFAVVALKELDAAVVASLRNTSIIFGVFLGAHLFDEGHRLVRYFAAGLIVGGVVLLIL